MREIKFRAWQPELKEMWPHDQLHYDNAILLHNAGTIGSLELMQYTGLKDKNGVEIYEGDIVQSFTDGEPNVWPVELTVDRDFNGWEVTPQHIEDGLVVIGNIYQYKELLEK